MTGKFIHITRGGYGVDRLLARLTVVWLVILGTASLAGAGTVNGTVTNGTTGKLAAGVDVILIQLQGGMQPIANTKADGQGRFHFDNPQLGAAPMLIRVPYKGVNYHQPVPPGTNTVQVQIYEATKDPGRIFDWVAVHCFSAQGRNVAGGRGIQHRKQNAAARDVLQPGRNVSIHIAAGRATRGRYPR